MVTTCFKIIPYIIFNKKIRQLIKRIKINFNKSIKLVTITVLLIITLIIFLKLRNRGW